MAVVTAPAYPGRASAAGASRRAAVAYLFISMAGEGWLTKVLQWSCLSIGLFAGVWEVCWWFGWADAKLLPPPHIFLGSIADQGKFFNTATRWQVGQSMNAGPSAFESVMVTVSATTMRVFAGLSIATCLGIGIGVLIRYNALFDKLVLPMVTLLSPVSPIAWLPVAIFLFGIGNAPAIFMVVVALFFHMVLSDGDADRRRQSESAQRRAPAHGGQQAPDLWPGHPAGHPARHAGGAAHEPVRRVDGRAGRRVRPVSAMAWVRSSCSRAIPSIRHWYSSPSR